jgi:hypothetical protein
MGDDLLLSAILDTGSVIEPWHERFGGPAVRRLSETGLEQLLDVVRATGGFERSQTFDAEPGWSAGWASYGFELTTATGPIRVVATNASSAPLARRLMRLGDALRDLDAMIASTAWESDGRSRRPLVPAETVIAAWAVPLPDAVVDLPDERIDVLGAWLPPELGDLGGPDAGRLVDDGPRCVIVDGAAGWDLQREVMRRFEPLTTGAVIDGIPDRDDPILGGVDLRSTDGGHLIRLVWGAVVDGLPAVDCPRVRSLPGPSAAGYAAGGADVAVRAAGGLETASDLELEVLIVDLAVGVPIAHRWFFADGRVASIDPAPPAAGYGVRRLTPIAAQAVRSLLAETPLPAVERTSDAFGGATRQYVLVTGAGVRFEATDVESDLLARRIVALAERLSASAGWLDEDAWIDRAPQPFRPARIAVSTRTDGAILPPRATWAMVAWPLEPVPIGPDGSGYDPGGQCTLLAPDVASSLAQALRRVAVPSGGSFRVAGPEPGTVIVVDFDTGDPGAPPSC